MARHCGAFWGEITEKMPKSNPHSGFTLVELAIGMVLMGLLVGGALMLQNLVEDARVSATVSQVTSYSNAVSMFRKLYVAWPGDMTGANLRLPGCPGVNGVACNPVGPSDSRVGNTAWTSLWGAPGSTTTGGLTGGTDVDSERYLFWAHLTLANLIGGTRLDGLNNAIPFEFNVTSPSVSSGGGLIVGYGGTPGVRGLGSIQAGPGVSGLIAVQVNDPKLALQSTTGQLPLQPLRAAQIDRKMDDGAPNTGYVQAYGVTGSCFCTTPTCPQVGFGVLTYDERITSKDCGLIYRIGD